jgi:tRNA(Ile)-lysidine synthetase-like protein
MFFPAALPAQSGTSVIAGLVKDVTGAPIPAATITVTNEDTGVASEIVSNAEGFYRTSPLPPGIYRLEVGFSGFQPFMRRAITLEVAQSLALDVTLEVAGQEETVDVVAERRATVGNGPMAVVRGDRLTESLVVRNRRPGDRFQPVGLQGRKKLQDLFVDQKVARAERSAVPLVVDARDRIVWVAGFGIDEAFRVTDAAQAVLLLRLTRA